jgi:serine/threonine protein kinase
LTQLGDNLDYALKGEIRAAEELRSPSHVVPVNGICAPPAAPGLMAPVQLWLVMPLLSGMSLRALIQAYVQQRSLLAAGAAGMTTTESERVSFVLQLLTGLARSLEYTHAKGVAHLDIKPENVMVSVDETGALLVRLVDFGSARLTGAVNSEKLSPATNLAITRDYSAPEAVRAAEAAAAGEHVPELTLRADVFSFGALALELLTGVYASELYKMDDDVKQEALAAVPGLPPPLQRTLLATVKYRPQNRPTAAELRAALEATTGAGTSLWAPPIALQMLGRLHEVLRFCFITCGKSSCTRSIARFLY